MSRKSELTETLAQAQRWDRVKKRYVEEGGLCDKCAAQAAWGHQIGFPLSHPPCEGCVPIVATFPVKASGQWRKLKPLRPMSADAVARLQRGGAS